MSWLSKWARRAISIPAYFGLATIYAATSPLWLVAALVADLGTGSGRRLPRTRALLFFALYLGCEIAGIAAAALLWLFTAGGRIGGAARFIDANAALQRGWAGTLFGASLSLFSMRVEIEGQDLVREGPLLLFVRHSSTADTVLTAALVGNPHRLLLRYVLKRELLWDPCLDIVGRRLPNAFIDRSGPRKEAEIAAIAQLATNLDARSAVLIYPEGTRFSREKLASATAMLREKGIDSLASLAAGFRNVLPPRLGGALALLDAAPGIDVVFVEHTGFEGAASFANFWNGDLVGGTIRVRLRRVPASSIPAEGRDRWLFDRWAEMDRWIENKPTT